MRRLLVLVFVVLLAPAVWTARPALEVRATPQPTPPRTTPGQRPVGTAALRGTVITADTGAPVRRAQVRAVAPDTQDNRVALTDEQGQFELRHLLGGRYVLTASRRGYVTLQYGQQRIRERGTPVELAPGRRSRS